MRNLAIALAVGALFSASVSAQQDGSERRVRSHRAHPPVTTPQFVDPDAYTPPVGVPNPYTPKVGAPNAFTPKVGAPDPYAPRVGAPDTYMRSTGEPVPQLPAARQGQSRH